MPAGCQCEFSLRLSQCVCVVLPSVCQCVCVCECVNVCVFMCAGGILVMHGYVGISAVSPSLPSYNWPKLCTNEFDSIANHDRASSSRTSSNECDCECEFINWYSTASEQQSSIKDGEHLENTFICRETHHRQQLNHINMRARRSLRYNVGTLT